MGRRREEGKGRGERGEEQVWRVVEGRGGRSTGRERRGEMAFRNEQKFRHI